MADAVDSKSSDESLVGSIPTPGTIVKSIKQLFLKDSSCPIEPIKTFRVKGTAGEFHRDMSLGSCAVRIYTIQQKKNERIYVSHFLTDFEGGNDSGKVSPT